MRPIPLEDNFNDILAKVMRGRRIGREQLAERAGLAPGALQSLLDGEFDERAARQVAPFLDLGVEPLVAIGQQRYAPEVQAPEGLLGFNTPFDDYHVNAYLVWDPATRDAVVFDTGSNVEGILDTVRELGLTVKLLLVTHTHLDHIMQLDALKAATGAPAYISALEPTENATPFEPGHVFELGPLRIETRKTTGHSRGGTSYVVSGLAKPLVVVGDALFAGSMGGGVVSFEDAITNNRRQIMTLADETIVCPGHGPLTSVGLEKRHNPFFPELN